MDKTRHVLAITLLCVAAACVETQRQQVQFCDIARASLRQPRLVRMHAQVVVTQHGSYLADERCPDEGMGWEDAEQFERAPEFVRFSEARREVMFGADARGFLSLSVDVEGLLRRTGEHSRC